MLTARRAPFSTTPNQGAYAAVGLHAPVHTALPDAARLEAGHARVLREVREAGRVFVHHVECRGLAWIVQKLSRHLAQLSQGAMRAGMPALCPPARGECWGGRGAGVCGRTATGGTRRRRCGWR